MDIPRRDFWRVMQVSQSRPSADDAGLDYASGLPTTPNSAQLRKRTIEVQMSMGRINK